MKFNIATVCRPKDFDGFLQHVRNSVGEGPLELLGYVVVDGPGCYNHGVMLEGPEDHQKMFIETLCYALQPGKYSLAPDDDPAVSEGVFEMRIEPRSAQ